MSASVAASFISQIAESSKPNSRAVSSISARAESRPLASGVDDDLGALRGPARGRARVEPGRDRLGGLRLGEVVALPDVAPELLHHLQGVAVLDSFQEFGPSGTTLSASCSGLNLSRGTAEAVSSSANFGPLRAVVPLAAGMMHIAPWRFYLANVFVGSHLGAGTRVFRRSADALAGPRKSCHQDLYLSRSWLGSRRSLLLGWGKGFTPSKGNQRRIILMSYIITSCCTSLLIASRK